MFELRKVEELKTTTQLVQQVLEEVPAARNSDNLLFIEVVKIINIGLIHKPLAEVLTNLKEYGLPSIETVGRCRRKLQAEIPELKAGAAVQGFRADREEEFREWARM